MIMIKFLFWVPTWLPLNRFLGTFTEYIATSDSNNSNQWLQQLFERSHIWLMTQNLIIKDLSLSVSSALDYRNVRCVSQPSYYHTRKGIQTQKRKTAIPTLCNAHDQVHV